MMRFEQIERWADDIVASSFENWPEVLRSYALAEPLESKPISPADTQAVLSQNASYRRFLNTARPVELPSVHIAAGPFKGDFFPKLGPVSWKEHAAFLKIPYITLQHMLPTMLRGVTERMALILHAFVARQVPLQLHIFPFIDLSDSWEVRFRIEAGEPIHARWQKRPGQSPPPKGSGEKLSIAAQQIVAQASIEWGLLDLVLLKSDDQLLVRVVEINPILEFGSTGRLLAA
ncbi:hypothetical protein [Sinorhizobium americanum]|uniref:ATP-grasp domain-containing protein n=1 Tax=Sinorhizobium americanum TaxID=194963 RepID=A0A4R2C2G2_9HYPH|nr:hypothetical protein [Sinorhizobium americanum]TCN33793.1 hypothetical protein EV184_10299 [Sinorhizobium americanum]